VVKDDGLAAGKGVVVTADRTAALDHARSVLAVGHRLVVEEYLAGPEVSLFVLTDGATGVPLVPAQDFKRIGDGDVVPNTGGMGAYTPLRPRFGRVPGYGADRRRDLRRRKRRRVGTRTAARRYRPAKRRRARVGRRARAVRDRRWRLPR
jgi:hypothetical protein